MILKHKHIQWHFEQDFRNTNNSKNRQIRLYQTKKIMCSKRTDHQHMEQSNSLPAIHLTGITIHKA